MSYLGLNPIGEQRLLDQAATNPNNELPEPDFFDGSLSAPFRGVASAAGKFNSVVIDDVLGPIESRAIGLVNEDWQKSFDRALEEDRQANRDLVRRMAPNPQTTGLAGKVLFGVSEVIPTFVAGSLAAGPVGGASLVGGVTGGFTFSDLQEKGVDPSTARLAAISEGAAAGFGALLPAGIGLSTFARAAGGAGINAGFGIGSRALTSSILEGGGYRDMAQQYKALDAEAIAVDVVLGAAFGGLSRATTKPVDTALVDAALAKNAAVHIEVDTAPGVPVNPKSRDAHVKAVNKALADLLEDKPVDVSNILDGAVFAPKVSRAPDAAVVERQAIELPSLRLGDVSRVKVGEAYVGARWAVVDAADLQATIGKGDNQFRDRTRAAYVAEVEQRARGIDPAMLLDSPVMDFGAPTVAADGRVVGGNGRVQFIQRAYELGTSDGYQQGVREYAAKVGIEPAALDSAKRPVLVRVLDDDVDVRQAAMLSNEGGSSRMSALEQAAVDGERLGSLEALVVGEDGNLNTAGNRDFLRAFLSRVPPNQRQGIVAKDGSLSSEGLARVRNAVMFKAYGDTPTLERLVEATDPGSRNVAAALVRVAPKLADVRAAIESGDLYPLDIAQDIAGAVEALDRLRQSGTSVPEFLAQGDLIGGGLTPEARALLAFFDSRIRSARAIGDMLAGYYDSVVAAGNPKQADIFGGAPPAKRPLLATAIQAAEATRETPAEAVAFDRAKATADAAEQMRVAAKFEADMMAALRESDYGKVLDETAELVEQARARGIEVEDVAPVKPTAVERFAPVDEDAEYQRIEKEIEAFEDRLDAQGIDFTKLYRPEFAEAMAGVPGYAPMPPELLKLHKQRDAIDARRLERSRSDIGAVLGKAGLSAGEVQRLLAEVLSLKGSRPTDAYMASEYTMKAVNKPVRALAEEIYIKVAAERKIFMDDRTDLFRDRDLTVEAISAAKEIKDYFGVAYSEDSFTARGTRDAVAPVKAGAAPARYTVFRGRAAGGKSNDSGVAGKGEYYAGRRQTAEAYARGGEVRQAEVELKRPYVATYDELNALQTKLYGKPLTGFEPDLSTQFDQWLREQGYDGSVLFDPEISTKVPEEVVKLAAEPNRSAEPVKAGAMSEDINAAQAIANNPDLTIPDGERDAPAQLLLDEADANIASSEQAAPGFDAAVACFLRTT